MDHIRRKKEKTIKDANERWLSGKNEKIRKRIDAFRFNKPQKKREPKDDEYV